jgi:hypothetical protein
MIPGLPSWPTTLQALALVVSPRLGLPHSPQVEEEVNVFIDIYKLFFPCNCFHLAPWPLTADFCGKTLLRANLGILKFPTFSWQVQRGPIKNPLPLLHQKT